MRHPLSTPKHHLIGHRGVAGLRPENTLCSFQYAADLGLNWIEFDVQLTKDDVWVVMHDDTLDRTTNGHGMLEDYTAMDLDAFDAGLWFRPPYPEQKIPTLLETLTLARQLNLFCNIELKVVGNQDNRYADLFKDFVDENPAFFTNNILLSSFNIECATQLTKLLPHLPTAYLIESWQPETLEIVQTYNFSSINCDVTHFNRDALMLAIAEQIPVFLYTVNDPSVAKYWIEQGVSGLFTDRPDLLQK